MTRRWRRHLASRRGGTLEPVEDEVEREGEVVGLVPVHGVVSEVRDEVGGLTLGCVAEVLAQGKVLVDVAGSEVRP
jgi:hypothetical protein